MEKSTLIGFIGGIASVGVGMALKGADPSALTEAKVSALSL